MIFKPFLYFLTDEQGRSYRIAANGFIVATGTKQPLANTPDGWQDTSIKYDRNETYYGMFRSYTTPLKFVRQGAHILRSFFYKTGFEKPVFLEIYMLDKTFGGGWKYKPFYRGEIDLSKSEDDENFFSVNIMEGGLDKLLKANENTKYEISMEDSITVHMHGIRILGGGNYELIEGSHYLDSPNGQTDFIGRFPVYLIGEERFPNGIKHQSATDSRVGKYPPLYTDDRYYVAWAQVRTENVRIAADFVVLKEMAPTEVFQVLLVINRKIETIDPDATTIIVRSYTIADLPFGNVLGGITFDYTIPVLEANDKVELLFRVLNAGTRYVYFTGGKLRVEAFSTLRSGQVQALRPMQVLERLVKKMAGDEYTVESEYLSTTWQHLTLASGDAVRGLANAVIKTSWSDFFTSYNVPCNLEMTIRGNTLVIEPKARAYRDEPVVNLGEVADFRVTVDENYLFSNLKIGYPDVGIDDVNGKDEFNVTQTYTAPVTRSTKTLELVSVYRASMYDIEFTRLNLEGKTTTNNDNDNECFFLLVEKSPTVNDDGTSWYNLMRSYRTITGVIADTTSFNVEISPKSCLRAQGNFIRSCFFFQQSKYLVFQSSLRNKAMVATYMSSTVTEEADQLISNLAEPMFMPYSVSFLSPVANDILRTMEENPWGKFQFSWNGDQYEGFPMSVGVSPSNRPAQETRLLFTAATDFKPLIHA